MTTLRYPWAWDFSEGDVLIAGVRIPVCLFSNPIPGRYLLSRRTEGWQLAPVVYDISGHGRRVPDMPFYLLVVDPSVAVNVLIEDQLAVIRT